METVRYLERGALKLTTEKSLAVALGEARVGVKEHDLQTIARGEDNCESDDEHDGIRLQKVIGEKERR